MSQEPVPFAYPDASAQYVPTIVPPPPPRLHWGWVLAISAVTVGLFGIVWLFVQSVWVKKASGRKAGFGWALGYLLYLPGAMIIGGVCGAIAFMQHIPIDEFMIVPKLLIRLAGLVLYVMTIYTLRSELEAEPIGISLGGVMTFFFGAIYFQYHLHDYGEIGGASASFSSPSGLGLNGAAPIAPERVAPPEI